ncbi:MAG: S8 family serine peptidase [Bacteroidota bacterium]
MFTQRIPTPHPARLLLGVALLLAFVLVSGCDTGLPDIEAESISPAIPADSKLRHGHLLERATYAAPRVAAEIRSRKGSAAPTANSSTGEDELGDGEYVGLIIGLDTYKVLSRYGEMDPYKVISRYTDPDTYKVLSRYGEMDPYKVISRYEYDNVFDGLSVWVSEEIVAQLIIDLSLNDEIEWIEPDIEVQLHPFGIREVSATGTESVSWGTLVSGESDAPHNKVDLFVMDTGISTDDVKLESAYDFTSNTDGSAPDIDGHGTHIAGIAAGLANQRGIRGVAPGAHVHALRVLTGQETDDGGPVDLSKAIAAVEHVVSYKLQKPGRPVVLNMSLGAEVGTSEYNALDEAVVAAIENDVTVVIAAGNAGIDASTVTPAHVHEAIVVGAYDQANQFASFSNYGATVDILAPGVDIMSLDHDSDDLVLMSGTSMAAPFVAGAAAAFLAENKNATPAQVEALLVESARSGIAGVPSGTTDRALDVLALTNDHDLLWLTRYALASGGDIAIENEIKVTSITGGNANIYTSGQLSIAAGTQARIDGFGYYAGSFSGDASVFRPRYNPTDLPVVMQQDPLELPSFQAQNYQHVASQQSSGTVRISGEQIQLGTAEAPVVWYVEGDLVLEDASITGYGVILVGDDLFVEQGSAIESASDTHATIAIYAQDDVRIRGHFDAHAFAQDQLSVDNEVRVVGGLAALGQVSLRADASITYAPLAQELLQALRRGQ